MSRYDYLESMKASQYSFYALIMAAMRNADTDNLEALQRAFPATWREFEARYHAGGGYLEGDHATS